jgi:dTDP-4-amino-4,6-dideoxygalactose transaminase
MNAAYGNFDAIMPVNIFGVQPVIPEGIPVVADLSHGFGGSLDGKKNGTIGTVCAFSCSITKPFHTIEGGIIASENEEIIKDVTSMARWCLTDDYNCTGAGQWSKLSEVHAIAGLESFKTLAQAIGHKNIIAKQYKEAFGTLPIEFQKIPTGCETTRKDFAILVPAKMRAKITANLKEKGIGYKLYFSPAVHETDYFKTILPRYYLPITQDVASRIICLPIHQDLSENDILHVADVIKGCF